MKFSGLTYIKILILITIIAYVFSHISSWSPLNMKSLIKDAAPFYVALMIHNIGYVEIYHNG